VFTFLQFAPAEPSSTNTPSPVAKGGSAPAEASSCASRGFPRLKLGHAKFKLPLRLTYELG
jgi:hypothetical protein